MTSVARLIKAKTISFTEEIIKNYSKLKLTEIEAMLLIHLYHQLDSNNNLLSVKDLTLKMSIDEDSISKYVISLIQKGFIELELNEGEEIFKLDGTYEAIAKLLDNQEEDNVFKDRQDLISQVILYIETTYARPCTPADLMIVNNWLDLGYSFQDIKKAILDSLKAKKLHLKYADAILASRKKQETRETVVVDADLKKMLDEMYVKK